MSAPTVDAVRDALKQAWTHEQGDRLTFTVEGTTVVVGVAPPDMRYEMPHVLTEIEKREEHYANEADQQLDLCADELGKTWSVRRRGLELVVSSPARAMGTEGPLLTPGSPEWLRTISASKIAAIAGVSPFDSPFSLYWKMAGTIVEPQTDAMRRGHYLEPAIAAWFEDQHPEFATLKSGTWLHPTLEWATASPDRALYNEYDFDGFDPPSGPPRALLEIKSTTQDHEWGAPGSDEVPPYVAVQCMWQLEVTGLDVCHVAVLGSFLEFSEYVVRYDAREASRLVDMAAEFLGKLERNEHPPIDDHESTWESVRELSPAVDSFDDCELGEDLAREYIEARHALKAAEDSERGAKARVMDAMGDAKFARYLGQKVAYREAKRLPDGGFGNPYLKAARPLPSIDKTQGEAAA